MYVKSLLAAAGSAALALSIAAAPATQSPQQPTQTGGQAGAPTGTPAGTQAGAPTASKAGIQHHADGDTIPAERVTDTYAIYGMLLPGEPFSSMPPDQVGRWAIADTTISIADMNPAIPPDGQLKPPDDNAKAFREALRDYEARRYERLRLATGDFHLTHPFSLLTDAQVGELRQARSSVTADSGLQGQYAGYPGVTFFTQVFFSNDQNAALVYRNNWCANLCSGGSWVYLEKHGGKWVLRSGITAPGA